MADSSVENEHFAYFSGKIPRPHNDGVVVVLQVGDGGGWRAFHRSSTRDGDRYSMRYRLTQTFSPTIYTIRAQVAGAPGSVPTGELGPQGAPGLRRESHKPMNGARIAPRRRQQRRDRRDLILPPRDERPVRINDIEALADRSDVGEEIVAPSSSQAASMQLPKSRGPRNTATQASGKRSRPTNRREQVIETAVEHRMNQAARIEIGRLRSLVVRTQRALREVTYPSGVRRSTTVHECAAAWSTISGSPVQRGASARRAVATQKASA
jgi:hypothetical protein